MRTFFLFIRYVPDPCHIDQESYSHDIGLLSHLQHMGNESLSGRQLFQLILVSVNPCEWKNPH